MFFGLVQSLGGNQVWIHQQRLREFPLAGSELEPAALADLTTEPEG